MVLMGIGIWFRVDPKMYEPTLYIPTDNFMAAAWIMMVTGLIITIVSFFGCYGAVVESTGCMCFVCFDKPCIFTFSYQFFFLFSQFVLVMSLMIAAEITGVVLAACRGFGADVSFICVIHRSNFNLFSFSLYFSWPIISSSGICTLRF